MDICIYGASSATLDGIFYSQTENLGQALGARGHGLVFGGGATGLMGAAARGFCKENARIVGIAPKFFDEPGILYEECTEFIYPADMRERKYLLESMSQVTIVAPGGIGTYEEFLEVLTLKSLKQIDRPIVLFNINGYYDTMTALMKHTADNNFMDEGIMDLYLVSDDINEIIEYIEGYKND